MWTSSDSGILSVHGYSDMSRRVWLVILVLRVLHLTTHYSMWECAICNTTTRYMTTNRTHNDIHG